MAFYIDEDWHEISTRMASRRAATEPNVRLSAREMRIISDRLRGKSFEAISKEMGLSKDRVRQISAKARRSLNAALVMAAGLDEEI